MPFVKPLQFASILGAAGVETVRLLAKSASLNAFAEGFVRSIRSECLIHPLKMN